MAGRPKDVSGKPIQCWWGVVHTIGTGGRRRVVWVDGPYLTRKTADDVKRENDQERRDDPDIDQTVRHTVVPMTYLLSSEEARKEFGLGR